MDINSLYVVACPLSEEKKLAQAISVAFERKLSVSKNASLLEGYRPQVLDHIWMGFRKTDGLFVELRHNKDVEGRLELADHADYAFILFTRVNEGYATANGTDPQTVQSYADACVSRLSYPVLPVSHPE